LVKDFIKLAEITPPNSWIWTWWDFGTAIQYYAGRAVYHDGQSQGSPKTYFIATTFSMNDPQTAYNTILGVSNLGAKGIKELLEEGKNPEDIRELIFKGLFSYPVKNPIYWVFTEDEIPKFAAISYLGTWNFKEKRGIRLPIYSFKCSQLNSRFLKCKGLIIDMKEGYLYDSQKKIPIRKLVIKSNKNLQEVNFMKGKIYVEVINKNYQVLAYLLSEKAYQSLFNQMFILRKYSINYFEIVYDDFPHMVVYWLKTGLLSSRMERQNLSLTFAKFVSKM
jgi:dolichyl-diphosphooligosaccharide--protein glycosyltransferase